MATSVAEPNLEWCGGIVDPAGPAADQSQRSVTGLLHATASALGVNAVATAALGMAFWTLASRMYSPKEVGTGAAMVSALLVLSGLTELNFNAALPRLLPTLQDRERSAIVACYAATSVAACLAAAVFLGVIVRVVPGLHAIFGGWAIALTFVLALVVYNIFAVEDAVLLGARRPALIPIENTAFGALKLIALVMLAGLASGRGIFLAWLIAAALVVVPINAIIFRHVFARESPRPPVAPSNYLVSKRSYLAWDWSASMCAAIATDVLPLIVVAISGRTSGAYFYIAFTLAVALAAFSQSYATALLAAGAHDPSTLPTLVAHAARKGALLVVPLVIGLTVLAGPVMAIFGRSYEVHGTGLLRLFVVAIIPQTIVAIAVSIQRVRGNARLVLCYQALTATVSVGLSVALLATLGLTGVGIAWLVAQCLTATVALPTAFRTIGAYRPSRSQAVVPCP